MFKKLINKVLETISVGSGMLGALSVDGYSFKGCSLIPIITLFGICFATAGILVGVKKYDAWNEAERKRKENIRIKRINRIHNANRFAGLQSR